MKLRNQSCQLILGHCSSAPLLLPRRSVLEKIPLGWNFCSPKGIFFPHRWDFFFYGAQNEAYRMTEGRKMGEVVSLQIVRRNLMIEAPQNETFT